MKRIFQGTMQFKVGENTYGIPINAITGPDGVINIPGPPGANGKNGKSPYINEDGIWIYFDDDGNEVNSGISAGGNGGSGGTGGTVTPETPVAVNVNVKTFDTVDAMKKATTLAEGDYVSTKGFYKANDGGAANYYIVKNFAANEIDSFSCARALQAVMIVPAMLSIAQLGAIVLPDGGTPGAANDNTRIINRAIEISDNVYIPSGIYSINGVVNLRSNLTIRGAGQTSPGIRLNGADAYLYGAYTTERCMYVTLESFRIFSSTRTPAPMLKFYRANYIVLRDMRVDSDIGDSWGGRSCVEFDDVQDSRILYSHLCNAGPKNVPSGQYITDYFCLKLDSTTSNSCNSDTIEGCRFEGFRGYAVLMSPSATYVGCNNVYFLDTKFESMNAMVPFIYVGRAGMYNCCIRGGYFYAAKGFTGNMVEVNSVSKVENCNFEINHLAIKFADGDTSKVNFNLFSYQPMTIGGVPGRGEWNRNVLRISCSRSIQDRFADGYGMATANTNVHRLSLFQRGSRVELPSKDAYGTLLGFLDNKAPALEMNFAWETGDRVPCMDETQCDYFVCTTGGSTGRWKEVGGAGSGSGDGTPGEDGKSAYEIAVENGFSGTQQQWLASLKGEAGNDGATPVFAQPTATSIASSASPSVEMTKNGNTYTLNFNIPKGEKGANGTGGGGSSVSSLGKLVIFGDSMSSGRGNGRQSSDPDSTDVYKNYSATNVEGYSYANVLAESGCFSEIYNYAVQNTSLVVNSVSSISSHAEQIRDADVVLIAYGGNDLKFMISGTSTAYTPGAIAAKIRDCIDEVRKVNAEGRIVFMSTIFPYPPIKDINTTGNYAVSAGSNLTLPMNENAVSFGMRMVNQLLAVKCYQDNAQMIMPFEGTTVIDNSFFVDTVHPNRKGCRMIGDHILRTLVSGETKIPDYHATVFLDNFTGNSNTLNLDYSAIELLIRAGFTPDLMLQNGAPGPYYYCQLSRMASNSSGYSYIEFVGGAKIVTIKNTSTNNITISDNTGSGTGSSGDGGVSGGNNGGSSTETPSVSEAPKITATGAIEPFNGMPGWTFTVNGKCYQSSGARIDMYSMNNVDTVDFSLLNYSKSTYATYAFLSTENVQMTPGDIRIFPVGSGVIGTVNAGAAINETNVKVPSGAVALAVCKWLQWDQSKYTVTATALRS